MATQETGSGHTAQHEQFTAPDQLAAKPHSNGKIVEAHTPTPEDTIIRPRVLGFVDDPDRAGAKIALLSEGRLTGLKGNNLKLIELYHEPETLAPEPPEHTSSEIAAHLLQSAGRRVMGGTVVSNFNMWVGERQGVTLNNTTALGRGEGKYGLVKGVPLEAHEDEKPPSPMQIMQGEKVIGTVILTRAELMVAEYLEAHAGIPVSMNEVRQYMHTEVQMLGITTQQLKSAISRLNTVAPLVNIQGRAAHTRYALLEGVHLEAVEEEPEVSEVVPSLVSAPDALGREKRADADVSLENEVSMRDLPRRPEQIGQAFSWYEAERPVNEGVEEEVLMYDATDARGDSAVQYPGLTYERTPYPAEYYGEIAEVVVNEGRMSEVEDPVTLENSELITLFDRADQEVVITVAEASTEVVTALPEQDLLDAAMAAIPDMFPSGEEVLVAQDENHGPSANELEGIQAELVKEGLIATTSQEAPSGGERVRGRDRLRARRAAESRRTTAAPVEQVTAGGNSTEDAAKKPQRRLTAEERAEQDERAGRVERLMMKTIVEAHVGGTLHNYTDLVKAVNEAIIADESLTESAVTKLPLASAIGVPLSTYIRRTIQRLEDSRAKWLPGEEELAKGLRKLGEYNVDTAVSSQIQVRLFPLQAQAGVEEPKPLKVKNPQYNRPY